MHQPIVLGAGDPAAAPLISNLARMLEGTRDEDHYNARVFLACYGRGAGMVRGLLGRGCRPRLMLDSTRCCA